MTSSEFKRKQSALGWTNARMAKELCKSAQSVSNYRNDRQSIPDHVAVMMEAVLQRLHAAK